MVWLPSIKSVYSSILCEGKSKKIYSKVKEKQRSMLKRKTWS